MILGVAIILTTFIISNYFNPCSDRENGAFNGECNGLIFAVIVVVVLS
jgi:hypothetical protein